MPLPNTVLTGSMIAATAMTAAGLNLGIMALGAADPAEVSTGIEQTAAPAESVDLLALPVAETEAVAAPDEVASVAASVATDAGVGIEVEHESEDDGEEHDAAEIDVEHDEGADDDDDESHDDGPDTSAATKAAVASSTTSRPPGTTTSTGPTTTRGTTTNTPAPKQDNTDPTAAAPATEYLMYEFKGVAEIIIALHDGEQLEFWSAMPAPGWVFRVDDDLEARVKIKFRPLDGGDEAEWELNLGDGELKLKQEY